MCYRIYFILINQVLTIWEKLKVTQQNKILENTKLYFNSINDEKLIDNNKPRGGGGSMTPALLHSVSRSLVGKCTRYDMA